MAGAAQALRADQDLVTAEAPEGALAVASVVAVVAGSDMFRRTVSRHGLFPAGHQRDNGLPRTRL